MNGLAYLNSLGKWGGTGEFSLTPIAKLLDSLGNPHERLRCVHVAGTNGKGSVSVAVASILGAAGYSVGLTISPHLSHISERIVIDGTPIDERELDLVALRIKAAADRCEISPSFFEAVIAAAFLVFEERRLDWVVLEVGLGGRLDATNVISKPVACAVTSIAFDHEGMLGETLCEIAREKAGIVKRGAVVVTGALPSDAAEEVARVANGLNCPIFQLERDFFCVTNGCGALFRGSGHQEVEFRPALAGPHQLANMGVAMELCSQLGINVTHLKAGIEQLFWPARLERIRKGERLIILDCAHNPAGIGALRDWAMELSRPPSAIAFGVLTTKRWQSMVDLLLPLGSRWYLLAPHSDMAVDNAVVAQYLSSNGVSAHDFGDRYRDCLMEIERALPAEGSAIVTGSIYMVGALRAILCPELRPLWRKMN